MAVIAAKAKSQKKSFLKVFIIISMLIKLKVSQFMTVQYFCTYCSSKSAKYFCTNFQYIVCRALFYKSVKCQNIPSYSSRENRKNVDFLSYFCPQLEVRKAISCLKSQKAPGYDLISPKILKELSEIGYHLLFIFLMLYSETVRFVLNGKLLRSKWY